MDAVEIATQVRDMCAKNGNTEGCLAAALILKRLADRSLACPNGCEWPLEECDDYDEPTHYCPSCSWEGVPPVYAPEPTPFVDAKGSEHLGYAGVPRADVDWVPIEPGNMRHDPLLPAPRATNAPEPVGALDAATVALSLAEKWHAAIEMWNKTGDRGYLARQDAVRDCARACGTQVEALFQAALTHGATPEREGGR